MISRFNEIITRSLFAGAVEALQEYGVDNNQITYSWVPGAYEIPLVANTFAASGQYDAVICLGAVIRGATPHFDYVCGPVAANIAKIALDHSIPVLFGVLTTNTLEEAFERSGSQSGNKGYDVAVAAIEMATLMQSLNQDFGRGLPG